jgi:hypothetical protein
MILLPILLLIKQSIIYADFDVPREKHKRRTGRESERI